MSYEKSATHLAALEYATNFGWFVFPIQAPKQGDPESGKRPITHRGKDDATIDPRIIDVWWKANPDANVGIACEPSGLIVLDVDVGPKYDKDGKIVGYKTGAKSLEEFDADLPQTLTAVTGGQGLHAVYKRGDSEALQKVGFREGLDLIGKGYIVAAPSLHWTGNRYQWKDVRALAVLPDVLRFARKKDKPDIKTLEDTSPGTVNDIVPIASGGRNIALFRLGAALRDTGIGAQALANALHWENEQRCVPPLGKDELHQIIDSIMRRVAPSRDVANSAVLQEEIKQIVQPAAASMWIYEVSASDPPPMHWYPTKFDQLDVLLGGGIPTRQVCGIIAPPSAGKSAFVGTLLDTLQATVPILHMSTELPREEIYVRYAALKLGFPWRDGMRGIIPRDKMREAVKDLRIKIIGSDNIDRADPIGQLAHEARQMRDQYGVSPGVAIDYMQMLSRGAEDVRQKVGEHTMATRILSQELDTFVLAVFSTGRAFYGDSGKVAKLREDGDPTAYLAAAKESGDIEFDCATMLYLDVDKMREGQPKPAKIAVARCRVGDVGFAGARAALDVGKWWGDAGAISDFSAEVRSDERLRTSGERDQLRVLEIVGKMPGRPWRDLQLATGIGRRADVAKSRLVELGKLVLENEVYYDHMARKQTRVILKIPNSEPPPKRSL